MYKPGTLTGNEKYMIFICPVPPNLTWQTVKDHIRTIAPTVNRVEIPRDKPDLKDTGWMAVKGYSDAANLFRALTQTGFFGQQGLVHMWETTESPPRLRASNCKPENCTRCFDFPVDHFPQDFAPVVVRTNHSQAQTYCLQHASSSTSKHVYAPFPSVNASRGARVTELTSVFITNLNCEVTDDEIRSVMREVGKPLSVCQASIGKKTHATVEFATPEEAQRAIDTFHGKTLKGWTLRIRHDRNQDSPKEGKTLHTRNGRSAEPLIVNGSNWHGPRIQYRA